MAETQGANTPTSTEETVASVLGVEVPDEAKPYMEAAVFIAAAARQISPVNGAMAKMLDGQSKAMFEIVNLITGGHASGGQAPQQQQQGCGDPGCKNCGGQEAPVSAEVNAEVEALVKDIEGLMAGDAPKAE